MTIITPSTIDNEAQQREKLLQPDLISGSEILLRSLLLEGVECVFGYPGGAVLYIYDAMHDNPEFKHVLTRHEQGAIHAADGYARSTGKVGVCIATSGPGATNLVTGIATAYMDSSPVVVITGNVPTHQMGTDAFQEADITGITMPITKHNYLVSDVADLARIIHEAFYIANTGRKGPVLIDIPKDVSAALTYFSWPDEVAISGYGASVQVDEAQADVLIDALATSKRPVIIAGAGVVHADAADEMIAFAQAIGAPVTTTLLGLGGFPGDHPLWLGMPGMHGTYAANTAIQHADLVIAIGARFDDRVTMRSDGFAPNARIAHVDVDPAEIGKILTTDYPVVGDVGAFLRYALARVISRNASSEAPGGPSSNATRHTTAWIEEIAAMKRDYPLSYKDSEEVLKPQWVIQMISDSTHGDAIITTDVGQHQMWVAQYYNFRRPKSLITSGGLGTMGFGFPASIGAQIGNPNALVISINGDGGMQMCSQELAICAVNKIPVKIVVINNQVLGMVRQWQELVYEGRYSSIDLSGSPDFVKLADAYGVKGLRATTKAEAIAAWQEALVTDGPVLIDFQVPKNECVFPMVPPGKTIGDMILSPDQA